MKKRIVGIVSLCVMLAAYCAFRFLLFEWHGMKDLPLYLLIAGAAVIVISGILPGNKIAPVFTATGYVVGFFTAQLLSADSYDPGGGRINNMWQIWVCSFAAAAIAGILIDVLNRKKRRES